MGLGSSMFTNATVVASIPEIWTPLVLKQLWAKVVAANFFTDLSSYAKSGGDIFHVPDYFTNSFTIQNQSTQGTEVTLGNPANVDITLTIDTHKYIAIQIGDLTLNQIGQGIYDPVRAYTEKMGSALADDLDVSLLNLWSGLTTNTVGDSATVLTDSEIRQAIEKLATANFNLNETGWFIHPFTFWIQLGAVAKYYDMSQSGMNFVREGNFGPMDRGRGLQGQLYGIPMYITSNIVTSYLSHRNLLAHKSAFGFATQTPGGSAVRVQSENKIEFLSNVTVVDTIYGVKELRDAAAVVVNAANTFIGS